MLTKQGLRRLSLQWMMSKPLFIVFVLGFSSGLPLALIGGTLQAWYAESGMSVLSTGMLSLTSLPYAYRMLWGPLLDRYDLLSLGKRRTWIVLMQCLLCLGFNALAFFSPQTSAVKMGCLALILACFSATQDMAIDAHRVEFLPVERHGLGASIATLGYRLALLITGGLSLVLAHYLGWAFTYHLMGFLLLPCMFVTWLSTEPVHSPTQPMGLVKSFIEPVKELLTRSGIVSLLCFILFYKLGEAFTTVSSGIVMPFLIQGLGFSLDTIGYVNKMIGILSTVLGGIVAGLVLMRYSLFNALMVFGLLQALSNSLFVLLAMVGKNLSLFIVAVFCDNFAAGMGTIALVALFMRLVNRAFTVTQFSFLVAVSSLPRIFSGPIAALFQIELGWVGLYQLAFLLSLCFVPFLIVIKKQIEENVTLSMTENDEINDYSSI